MPEKDEEMNKYFHYFHVPEIGENIPVFALTVEAGKYINEINNFVGRMVSLYGFEHIDTVSLSFCTFDIEEVSEIIVHAFKNWKEIEEGAYA